MSSVILCDVGGTNIRFSLSKTIRATELEVSRYEVRKFSIAKQPFHAALRQFLQESSISSEGAELRLSLPGDVTGKIHRFNNLRPAWQIDFEALRREFRFRKILALNDAVAAFHSLFVLLGRNELREKYLEPVKKGSPPVDGRLVLVSPGTGLGAAGGYLENERGVGKFWTPIPSEFGSTHARWKDQRLNRFIDDLENDVGFRHSRIQKVMDVDIKGKDKFRRREYLLSGPGLIRIYYSLLNEDMTERFNTIDNITQPRAIILRSLNRISGNKEDDAAYEALNIFCIELADAIFDLSLTFNARVGVFMHGFLVGAIGTEGLRKFGFVDAFNKRAQEAGYGTVMPIYLVTHLNLELVGLNCFK